MDKKCNFCNLDTSKIYNTLLEETNNFFVIPTLGSLTEGYVLIVSKTHLYNMAELCDNTKEEYFNLIEKYRTLFKQIYNKYPIVFEHGTSKLNLNKTSSSVVHAHTHIVNHNYIDELALIKELKFKRINKISNYSNKNYIFYISPNNKKYITTNFESISQLMRIKIAKDLGFEDKYNWKEETFNNNIISTIQKLKIH